MAKVDQKINNVLVTGGAGFIGSFLVDSLIEKGYKVKILDNLDKQVHNGKKPKYLNKRAEFLQGDVTNYSDVRKSLEGVDVVYHLAAAVGVAQSNYEVRKFMKVNVLGTANIFDALANNKHTVKKVIVPSSNTGLGEGSYICKRCGVVRPSVRVRVNVLVDNWDPLCPSCSGNIIPIGISEEEMEFPNSIYAISKKTQQEMGLLFGRLYNIPTIVLRFFNVYGPRQSLSNPYTGVAAIFISRLKNNKPILIYEDGLQSRDFINVRDVVSALILAMESDTANYQLINIGSGKSTAILTVAKTLQTLIGKKGLISVSNNFRKGDIRHCVADIKKAKKLLKWSPKISLKEGLKELIEWSLDEDASDEFNHAHKQLEKRGLT